MLGYWFIIDLIYMQRFGVLLVCIRCRLLPVPAYFLQTMPHSTLQLIGYRDVVIEHVLQPLPLYERGTEFRPMSMFATPSRSRPLSDHSCVTLSGAPL